MNKPRIFLGSSGQQTKLLRAMMAADGWDEIAQKIESWIIGVLSESAVDTRTTPM